MNNLFRVFITTSFSLILLTACEVGPDYKRPPVEVPATYKEAGTWHQATPNDSAEHGTWWVVYKDPILDDLEQRVMVSNQTLKAAEAAYREANAIAEETRATLFPTLTVNAAAGRQSGPMPVPVSSNSLYAAAAWVPDIWGRIRRTLESDNANAEASAADLAAARLSMQATLATDYFDLRAQDELKRLLDLTVESNTKALQIVQHQYDTGTATMASVLAAQTQLESAKAQAINAEVRRAQLEHAIAVLTGEPPVGFSLEPKRFSNYVPEIPAGLPSALLERRPDIASAERMVAAANARIGVATAAWFPDLMLSASSGYDAMSLSNLLQASNAFWAIGPTLAETVFDAGGREAGIKKAHADYDRNVAVYRQTLLTAFQKVEDGLSDLRIMAEQEKAQEAATVHARIAEQLTLNQYTNGTTSYNNALIAQTARLRNEQALLMVRQSRLEASVALIKALGGGWDVSRLPH